MSLNFPNFKTTVLVYHAIYGRDTTDQNEQFSK